LRVTQAIRARYNQQLYSGQIDGYGKVLFPK